MPLSVLTHLLAWIGGMGSMLPFILQDYGHEQCPSPAPPQPPPPAIQPTRTTRVMVETVTKTIDHGYSSAGNDADVFPLLIVAIISLCTLLLLIVYSGYLRSVRSVNLLDEATNGSEESGSDTIVASEEKEIEQHGPIFDLDNLTPLLETDFVGNMPTDYGTNFSGQNAEIVQERKPLNQLFVFGKPDAIAKSAALLENTLDEPAVSNNDIPADSDGEESVSAAAENGEDSEQAAKSGKKRRRKRGKRPSQKRREAREAEERAREQASEALNTAPL